MSWSTSASARPALHARSSSASSRASSESLYTTPRQSFGVVSPKQRELESQNTAIYLLNVWSSRTKLRTGFGQFKRAVRQKVKSPSSRRSLGSPGIYERREAQDREHNTSYAIALAERERRARIQSMLYDTHEFRITFTRPTPHLGLDLKPNEVMCSYPCLLCQRCYSLLYAVVRALQRRVRVPLNNFTVLICLSCFLYWQYPNL